MNDQQIISELDFARLYRNHVKRCGRVDKTAQQWNKRAQSMSKTCGELHSPYVESFISHMNLDGVQTLLDVGCGSGTISLSLAPHFEKVYGLDYSQGMLDVLKGRADYLQIRHVECLLKAWEDNWDDVPPCDIVVASRSTMVIDLEDAVNKLNKKAKKRVYITAIVDYDVFSRQILQSIGRDPIEFPDYIYFVNLLHQKGYHACVNFISVAHFSPENKLGGLAGFIESVRWSMGELTPEEIAQLTAFYETNATCESQLMPAEKKWALISWETG